TAVVVATGSETSVPPIPGLREAKPWTNREATTAKEVPGRLLVLGGGVSGVELAQAWASFGSRVAVIEAMPRLLGREESFAAELVHAALVDRGIDVRVGVKAIAASRNGEVGLELETGDRLAGDELVGAGGRPERPRGRLWDLGRRRRQLLRPRRARNDPVRNRPRQGGARRRDVHRSRGCGVRPRRDDRDRRRGAAAAPVALRAVVSDAQRGL